MQSFLEKSDISAVAKRESNSLIERDQRKAVVIFHFSEGPFSSGTCHSVEVSDS